jgi:hypothetical protein
MKIKEMVFYVTKATRYEIIINKENGYDMPESPKELIDTVTAITNNPAQELAWSNDNVIEDGMVIDSYDIKEVSNNE